MGFSRLVPVSAVHRHPVDFCPSFKSTHEVHSSHIKRQERERGRGHRGYKIRQTSQHYALKHFLSWHNTKTPPSESHWKHRHEAEERDLQVSHISPRRTARREAVSECVAEQTDCQKENRFGIRANTQTSIRKEHLQERPVGDLPPCPVESLRCLDDDDDLAALFP